MTRVVTWQSPAGERISITPAQERRLRASRVWPRDRRGEEYCQVHRGLHVGPPSYDAAGFASLLQRLTAS